MAKIYDEQLKDSQAAVTTWKEIVRQFSGTSVAEDASWRIAQFYERSGEHQRAIESYEAFLRNYRRSPNAGPAQAAIAENYERLGEWIKAMDAYTNYLNNYPDGAFAKKSRDRINWIKTYRL
jgi:outer membrane protein assembly factor BamD (BamD/ComL family)